MIDLLKDTLGRTRGCRPYRFQRLYENKNPKLQPLRGHREENFEKEWGKSN